MLPIRIESERKNSRCDIKEYDISTPEALANTVVKVAEERHITIFEEKLGKISQEATRNPEEIAAIFTRMIKTMKLPPQ